MLSVHHTTAARCIPGTESDNTRAVASFLQESYEGELSMGASKRAPSDWWRNELEFLSEPRPQRWVTRVHFFEAGPTSEGRYIGFTNMRPPGAGGVTRGAPPIADAFLAPPRRMQGSGYKLVCVSELAQVYGEKLFSCLPYTMPVRELGGLCAQACLYMAMLAMTPYGARPMGPLDMTVWLRLKDKETWGSRLTETVEIRAEGLNPTEQLTVLKEGPANLWGLPIVWPKEDEQGQDNVPDFLRLIRQYVEAGLPVILYVDFAKLHPAGPVPPPGHERHAILLVGCGPSGPGEGLFVYQDPFVGPYLEASWSILSECVYWFQGDEGLQAEAVVVCPRSVTTPLESCEALALAQCDTRDWIADLVPGSHFVRRAAKVLTGDMHRPSPNTTDVLAQKLDSFFPSAELPAFMWLLYRHRADEDCQTIAFFYDAEGKSSNASRLVAEVKALTSGPGQTKNEIIHGSDPGKKLAVSEQDGRVQVA